MKNILYICISLLIIIGTYSCSEIDLVVVDSNKAVVEGYLLPGHNISIKVTKQIPFGSSDTIVTPIEDLSIILDDGLDQLLLTFTDSVYTIDNYSVIENINYSIGFNYNDKTISSETYVPTKPESYQSSASSISIEPFVPGSGILPTMPDPIELTWENPDNDYFLVVAQNIESNPVPINDTTSFRPPRIFRNMPIQGNYYRLEPMNFSYYGTHNIILYKLNPEYAELYEDNGNSSLNLEEPPGNIVNGLGIFTGLSADTIKIEVYN